MNIANRPWTVQPVGGGWRINAPNRHGQLTKVADITPRADRTGEANAHLMAAAPDLLAACEEALAALTYPRDLQIKLGVECDPRHEDLALTLRLAIRKAHGETV